MKNSLEILLRNGFVDTSETFADLPIYANGNDRALYDKEHDKVILYKFSTGRVIEKEGRKDD